MFKPSVQKRDLFLAFFLFLLAFSLRLWSIIHATKGLLLGFDPCYHARFARDLVRSGSLPKYDTLGYYSLKKPVNAKVNGTILYYYIVASFYWLSSFLLGAGYDEVLFNIVVALIPAFFGALSAFFAYFIFKEVFGRSKISFISGILYATLAGLTYRAMAGFSEEDATGSFFMVLSFYLALKLFKSKGKERFLYLALLSISLPLFHLIWAFYQYGAAALLTFILLGSLYFSFNPSPKAKNLVFISLALFPGALASLIPFYGLNYTFKRSILLAIVALFISLFPIALKKRKVLIPLLLAIPPLSFFIYPKIQILLSPILTPKGYAAMIGEESPGFLHFAHKWNIVWPLFFISLLVFWARIFSVEIGFRSDRERTVASFLLPALLSIPLFLNLSPTHLAVAVGLTSLSCLYVLFSLFMIPKDEVVRKGLYYTLSLLSLTLLLYFLSKISKTPVFYVLLASTFTSFLMLNLKDKIRVEELFLLSILAFSIVTAWVKLKYSFISSVGLSFGLSLLLFLSFEKRKERIFQTAFLSITVPLLLLPLTPGMGAEKTLLSLLVAFSLTCPVFYYLPSILRNRAYEIFSLFMIFSVVSAGLEFVKIQSPPLRPELKEAYDWMRSKTPEGSKFLAWWNYGHHITYYGERATLLDNTNASMTLVKRVAKLFSTKDMEYAKNFLCEFKVDYLMLVDQDFLGFQAYTMLSGEKTKVLPVFYYKGLYQGYPMFQPPGANVAVIRTEQGYLFISQGRTTPLPFRYVKELRDAGGRVYGLLILDESSSQVFLPRAFLGQIPWLKQVWPEKGGTVRIFKVLC